MNQEVHTNELIKQLANKVDGMAEGARNTVNGGGGVDWGSSMIVFRDPKQKLKTNNTMIKYSRIFILVHC